MIGLVFFLVLQFPLLFIVFAMMQGGAFSPTGNDLAFWPTLGVIELVPIIIGIVIGALERR